MKEMIKMTSTAAQEYSDRYETNPLSYDHNDVAEGKMFLDDVQAAGGKITRLRMFVERGQVDVSYCHATLPDGSIHRVSTSNFYPSTTRKLKGDIIAWAKAENAYAKGLGLLDESNWSILR